MLTEQYVSFETAKLLKEKGFDETIFEFYTSENKVLYSRCKNGFTTSELDNHLCKYYPHITQQMAMRYLRENYGINLKAEEKRFCETSHDGMRVKKVYYHWCPEIQLLHDTKIHVGLVPINQRMEIYADSYENAIDKGIEWVLENLL